MRELSTILLVDDDPISNYITQELLQDKQLCPQLVVVTDGKQALDYLAKNLPANTASLQGTLVLLDLNMPVMDGFEFMEELETLQLHKQIVVAVLTSSDNHKDITQAKKFSFAAYLQKPVAIEEIKALVAQHFK